MKPKYTPGPWKVRFVGDEIWINSTHWEALAKVSSVPEIVEENTGENQGMDNARLIAAAPELLYGCKAALKFIQAAAQEKRKQGITPDGMDALARDFRYIIQKAEGRG